MLAFYLGVYILVVLAIFKIFHFSKENRKKLLSPLFLMNMFLFIFFTVSLSLFYGTTPSTTELIVIYGLLTVGVFVATIEIPGFLLLSNFDEEVVSVLEKAKADLINTRAHFNEGIVGIKNALKNNKETLTQIHAYDQIEYYETSSTEMGQANLQIFDLTLFSINQLIKEYGEKSKHPFPKLVDVFSLAGLSFLIAHFLK
jgi:hypothetical protein